MSRLGSALLLIATIFWIETTHALTTEQLKAVQESVLEMCRGGSLQGEQASVVVKGAGEAKVVLLKKLAELGLKGEVAFSETEWDGIKPLLPETLQHEIHVKCVITLTPMILEKLEEKGGQPSSQGHHLSIDKALRDLGSTKGNTYDLRSRMAALRTLQTIGIETSEIDIKRMIMNELQTYIKANVRDRKTSGEGIEEDRGTFRADDIVAAIEALQAIRRASGGRLDVDLTNINFDRVNLVKLDLESFNFAFSSFQHAFLSGSNMKNALFNFANLSYAAIWNADMSGANFHKAILRGTKFANVQLAGSNIEQAADRQVALFGARGLTKDQIARFPRYDQ
jgi:uncharacterized protein YjbI with pentapeptide repeats